MSEYDYVIVGSGPAGCALAARLASGSGVSVLLIEAGPRDRSINIRIPAAFAKLFKSRYDWGFETAPQDGLDGRRVYFPRGKVLGGCLSVNAQMYVRGHHLDYDGWGVSGWAYRDLLPYFRRAERNSRCCDDFHGGDGPWWVSDQCDPNPLSQAFVAAAAEAEIESNPDFNAARLDGAGLVQVMQHDGRRFSAADAYLRTAPTNLQVLTGAHATRVVITGGRAEGVEYHQRGTRIVARARREVILCAGAVGTPHLLMLSGVGPAEHLHAHGLTVVQDLPGVGCGLHDHPMVVVMYETVKPVSLRAAESPGSLLRYLLRRRGMLTSNIAEAAAFARTNPQLEAPDLELIFAPVLYLDEGLAKPPRHGFSIGVVALQPASRGVIALRSADPFAMPVIQPQYLSDPADAEVMMHGVTLARHIVAARPFDALRGGELEPGPGAQHAEDIEAWIRSRAHTVYHPVGSCRLGLDALAVVDPELRVRGIERLRVADVSVLPSIVRGHTAAVATAIGERAADLLRGAGPVPAAATTRAARA